MKAIDKYYERPLLYDFILSGIIIAILFVLESVGKIAIPEAKESAEFASDAGAIGFTISGFVLTFIAILVTLKSGQIVSGETLTNQSSPFKIFLASGMYSQSIKILKTGVLSLIVVSLLLYVLKISLGGNCLKYIFYADVLCLIVILLTFLRCFYILDIIIKMQGATEDQTEDK